MSKKKTLVLGASANPDRYSYLCIRKLREMGYPVVAVGLRQKTVGDVVITAEKTHVPGIDTITLYLNASNQRQYYDYILSLKPKRIIFNPGAENDELVELAEANNIEPMDACTLVLLSSGQY